MHNLNEKMITVIGAANVDITASPIGRYVPCDSNPSRVEISYGGVGRNIAHNLCLMGERVRLFTVFGDDSIALSLRDDCRRVGRGKEQLFHLRERPQWRDAGGSRRYGTYVAPHARDGGYSHCQYQCQRCRRCRL